MQTVRACSFFLMMVLVLVGCATATPPSRIGHFVPVASSTDGAAQRLPTSRPVRAALVVFADRPAPASPQVIPEAAQDRLAGMLGELISQGFPLRIERVVNLGEVPSESTPDWTEMARQQGVEHLVVVVLSNTEQEYPVSLFLGWTTHRQPGFRRDNWSLAEAALVDGRTGEVLLNAEGRAMATLDSPTAPGINQWYPVIYLRPQDPERRIWPPTYEGAPLTLRVVAMEHAVKRLAGNLQRAWVERRDIELAAAAQP